MLDIIAALDRKQTKKVDVQIAGEHLMDAPQIMIELVGSSLPRYILLTPSGEYLGEIKFHFPLSYVHMLVWHGIHLSLPFQATLYDHQGKMLGFMKKKGFLTSKGSYFTNNGELMGEYLGSGLWDGNLVDANGKEIIYTDSGSNYRNTYLEDAYGNQVVSVKRSISVEENKKLFPDETVIVEFHKDRTKEEKSMLLMSWCTAMWM
ncbi:hypothetical protein [Priestia taiwanensis]|uniref:Uncharacterized protein n=1 Tax=Priestia taiwanensis TaxID=1347902 RepID=A0A917ARP7_9BACI|nr:hypothetical protein [Priestia taiwanensis]MBM7363278.1 hypothetical protein [Priestia taiwanensis]GGE69091.1 hypothetical protein GCM10007140_18970 [Priestia taiwanensis]